MVDDQSAAVDAAPPESEAPTGQPTWATMWQVPTILGSLVLIALGLYVAGQRSPDADIGGAIDQAERLVSAGEFESAARLLNETIHPNRHLATAEEEGRFHRAVADWLYLSQRKNNVNDPEMNRRIAERYAMAQDRLGPLASVRLERWALTLISLGDLDGARQRETELEAMAGRDESAADSRRRVARRIVDAAIDQPDLSFERQMELLGAYRASRELTATDEAWTVARQAELRLETERYDEAITRLLVDMRRLEQRHREGDRVQFGELYTLLGHAYYQIGEYDEASFHLSNALETYEGAEAGKGKALVVLGHIAVADDRLDEAYGLYDDVVRDFQATAAHREALLSRAAVNSVLGRHDQAEDDFGELLRLRREAPRGNALERDEIVQVLVDRHDASLATANLEQALRYAELVGQMYENIADAPAEVLLRLASTSRQIAENLIGDALPDDSWGRLDLERLDPALRAEANSYYMRAGQYYIRHARKLAPRPGADDEWAESLWLAADSYDLSGMHEHAVIHFREYVDGRSSTDPRRPEALYRLAQAYHASLDHEQAVTHYEQVLSESPRSPFAARSYVPLAQCYLALGRRAEAEQELIEVVKGNRDLEPTSVDYREAQIALGKLYYDDGQYVKAIEELDRALKRYPDDPRVNETRFRLAYCYFKQAEVLAEQSDEPARPRAEVASLRRQRQQYLTRAMHLFADVRDGYEQRSARQLDRRQRDFLRHAYLYRADCAFELAEDDPEMYHRAIELYDQAARQYVDHHASMVALIQIVACYQRLGDEQRARTAHRRAMVRLSQLPDDAFDGPDALLGREAWERWLRHMPLDEAMAAVDRP